MVIHTLQLAGFRPLMGIILFNLMKLLADKGIEL